MQGHEINLNQLQRFYYSQWRISSEATWLSEAMALEGETEDGLDDHCAICGQRGLLVCCDACSNVYHLACVKLNEVPDGEWKCPDCLNPPPRHNTGRPQRAGAWTGPVKPIAMPVRDGGATHVYTYRGPRGQTSSSSAAASNEPELMDVPSDTGPPPAAPKPKPSKPSCGGCRGSSGGGSSSSHSTSMQEKAKQMLQQRAPPGLAGAKLVQMPTGCLPGWCGAASSAAQSGTYTGPAPPQSANAAAFARSAAAATQRPAIPILEETALGQMAIKDLRAIATQRGIPTDGVNEKAAIVAKIVHAQTQQQLAAQQLAAVQAKQQPGGPRPTGWKPLNVPGGVSQPMAVYPMPAGAVPPGALRPVPGGSGTPILPMVPNGGPPIAGAVGGAEAEAKRQKLMASVAAAAARPAIAAAAPAIQAAQQLQARKEAAAKAEAAAASTKKIFHMEGGRSYEQDLATGKVTWLPPTNAAGASGSGAAAAAPGAAAPAAAAPMPAHSALAAKLAAMAAAKKAAGK